MLVVEDEPLVGLDLADILGAAGARVVSTNMASEAISSLDRFEITAAVLDINLGDHDCDAVSEHLWKRAIPFLFYTGYSLILSGWDMAPVLQKPAVPRDIVEAVERLCGSIHRAA
jgi:DNA-binding response OmpR family regulator